MTKLAHHLFIPLLLAVLIAACTDGDGPGDITLKASYIEIKNSTTVPLGTILTIEN